MKLTIGESEQISFHDALRDERDIMALRDYHETMTSFVRRFGNLTPGDLEEVTDMITRQLQDKNVASCRLSPPSKWRCEGSYLCIGLVAIYYKQISGNAGEVPTNELPLELRLLCAEWQLGKRLVTNESMEEKLRCDAGTYHWLLHHIHDGLKLMPLIGFGCPGGDQYVYLGYQANVTHTLIEPAFKRIADMRRGSIFENLGFQLVKDFTNTNNRRVLESYRDQGFTASQAQKENLLQGILLATTACNGDPLRCCLFGSCSIESEGDFTVDNRPLTKAVWAIELCQDAVQQKDRYANIDNSSAYVKYVMKLQMNHFGQYGHAFTSREEATRRLDLFRCLILIMKAHDAAHGAMHGKETPYYFWLPKLGTGLGCVVNKDWELCGLSNWEWACFLPMGLLNDSVFDYSSTFGYPEIGQTIKHQGESFLWEGRMGQSIDNICLGTLMHTVVGDAETMGILTCPQSLPPSPTLDQRLPCDFDHWVQSWIDTHSHLNETVFRARRGYLEDLKDVFVRAHSSSADKAALEEEFKAFKQTSELWSQEGSQGGAWIGL